MKYKIKHTYKEKVIIPVQGVNFNGMSSISFLADKEQRIVITSDNIECNVVSITERHLCDLESDIQLIYGCDAWSWLKRWYRIDERVNDLRVLILELKKI